MQGKAQAGVTWQSEVRFQEQAGHPIEGVAIPDAQNTTAIYGGAIVKSAPHPEAAQRWPDFIRSPEGLAISIGKASWRARVGQYVYILVVAVSVKKKKKT